MCVYEICDRARRGEEFFLLVSCFDLFRTYTFHAADDMKHAERDNNFSFIQISIRCFSFRCRYFNVCTEMQSTVNAQMRSRISSYFDKWSTRVHSHADVSITLEVDIKDSNLWNEMLVNPVRGTFRSKVSKTNLRGRSSDAIRRITELGLGAVDGNKMAVFLRTVKDNSRITAMII